MNFLELGKFLEFGDFEICFFSLDFHFSKMNFFAIFALTVVDAFTVGGGNSCSDNSACAASEYCGTIEVDSNGDVTTTNVCAGKDLLKIRQKFLMQSLLN